MTRRRVERPATLSHVSTAELRRWLRGCYRYYESERGTPDGLARASQIGVLRAELTRRGVRQIPEREPQDA